MGTSLTEQCMQVVREFATPLAPLTARDISGHLGLPYGQVASAMSRCMLRERHLCRSGPRERYRYHVDANYKNPLYGKGTITNVKQTPEARRARAQHRAAMEQRPLAPPAPAPAQTTSVLAVELRVPFRQDYLYLTLGEARALHAALTPLAGHQ